MAKDTPGAVLGEDDFDLSHQAEPKVPTPDNRDIPVRPSSAVSTRTTTMGLAVTGATTVSNVTPVFGEDLSRIRTLLKVRNVDGSALTADQVVFVGSMSQLQQGFGYPIQGVTEEFHDTDELYARYYAGSSAKTSVYLHFRTEHSVTG